MAKRQRKRIQAKRQDVVSGPSMSRSSKKKTLTPTTTDTIVQLQQTIGNKAVSHLIHSGRLQAELKIDSPKDRYEHEADSVAQRVISMPQPAVQTKPDIEKEKLQKASIASSITPLIQKTVDDKEKIQKKSVDDEKKDSLIQRATVQNSGATEKKDEMKDEKKDEDKKFLRKASLEKEKEKEKTVQTQSKSDGEVHSSTAVPNHIESAVNEIKGGGRPLTNDERNYFEPRFGTDFQDVRIHTDSKAASVAELLEAKAFTIGTNIALGAGHTSTSNLQGKQLLGHELTHVLQQSDGQSHHNSIQGAFIDKKNKLVEKVNQTALYLHGAEIKYETDLQRKMLLQVFSDIQTLSATSLKSRTYADQSGVKGKWNIMHVFQLFVITNDSKKSIGPYFYGELESDEVQAIIKRFIGKLQK